LKFLIYFIFLLLSVEKIYAQLIVVNESSAQVLAQKLVGEGVTVSNIVFRGSAEAVGTFVNSSGTSIGLDSGIILTNGRLKSDGPLYGVNGNGINSAITSLASLQNFPTSVYSGDSDLASLLNIPNDFTHDATVLEFDFIPLGDSIRFRYVFSSEEYPEFACPGPFDNYNDAFAFFIEGPGFPFRTNIALVPGTNSPVTINNVNDQSCALYPQYYVNNEGNKNFTHNGHTSVFTALAAVQPCQVYHLKLVISDVADAIFDSGVFLESKSLTSNLFQLTNLTQTDPVTGQSYLVEGCATGSLRIRRQAVTPFSQTVFLAYGGSALNTLDVATLPSSVIIPAGQSDVLVTINPVVDNLPEGIETLKIYTLAACGGAVPTDSASIQIRDYDILQLSPGMHPDTAFICRNASQQLTASTGYSQYRWDPDPELNNVQVRTPVATPASAYSKYYCTATEGTCNARDSINIKWKRVSLGAVTDIRCSGTNTGQISVTAGTGWQSPLEYSANGITWQPSALFTSLNSGNYSILIRDAAGCRDSVNVVLTDLFPPLSGSFDIINPSCSGNADGALTLHITGGSPPYSFSRDAVNYQADSFFILNAGMHTIHVKDANNCTRSFTENLVMNNDLDLVLNSPLPICEGTGTPLMASSSANIFQWSPSTGLSNASIRNPVASPSGTTKYFCTATSGICSKTDSLIVEVKPAPVAYAGNDKNVCFGGNTGLSGSGGVSFNWRPTTFLDDPTSATPAITRPLSNVQYYLDVTDANGCRSLKPDTINLILTPAVKIFAGRDTMIAINQPLRLYARELSNSGVISYEWSPSRGLNNSGIYDPVAVNNNDITYYVTGRTADNCEGSDTINIKVYKGPEIYVPTAFTPNGDGHNDVLRPICIGISQFNYFRIFNRYGQVIFQTSDAGRGWDGRLKGKEQDPGTYVWVAAATDFRGNSLERKGTFTIIR